MPTPQVAVAPFPSAPAQASDVVSMVSAVVDALNIPSIVKKCSKRAQDSDADSEEGGSDRFARLTSFGSQELRKNARSKTLSEMKLQSELIRLRNSQNDRKVGGKGNGVESETLMGLTLVLLLQGFRPLPPQRFQVSTHTS